MPNLKKTTQRPWIPKPKPRSEGTWQGKETNAIYHTTRWKRLRLIQLKRHPLCVECNKNSRVKAANVADHIIRITDGGEPYDLNNLQSLCTACHNSKSGKEAHIIKVY